MCDLWQGGVEDWKASLWTGPWAHSLGGLPVGLRTMVA